MKHIDPIAQTRNQMIKAGMNLGLTHERTVKLSQELDGLLNEEMRGNKHERI